MRQKGEPWRGGVEAAAVAKGSRTTGRPSSMCGSAAAAVSVRRMVAFCGACRAQSPGRVCGTASPHPDQRLIHRPTKTEVTAVVAALCRACVLRSLRQTDADHLHERRTAVAASALRGVVEWLLRSQPILSRNTNNRDS
jgi:hypothetical protein